MSTDTATLELPSEAASDLPETDSLVDVRVDELIVGRPLKHPIYDANGILLLAEGALITSEFKHLLKQRNMSSIQVHQQDVDRVSLSKSVLANQKSTEAIALDSVVAKQLDKVIDSGLLMFQNNGPAFKQDVVYHGKKAYDLEKHATLRDQRTATSESLNNMMKEALHGRGVSSSVINQLAANYLTDMSDDTDCVLAVAMEATKDSSLADHCFKMSMLATAVAIEMGMDEENCRRVCVAGLVHDWGMAKVPAEIRNSPRLLSDIEFFQIKKHPIFTAEMLEKMPGVPSMVPLIAYQVHERPNGLGYPRGRSGDRIHILARILGAADMFTALTEERPYRRPLAPYAAMECMVRLARSRDVDPEVVRSMLKVMCLFPIGSLVTLDDGSVAQILRRNGEKYATPIIQRLQDSEGNLVSAENPDSVIDLAESPLGIVQALPTPGRDEILLSDDILFPTRPK